MLKFYRALNFRANEVHDHETQALLENSLFQENAQYFHNRKIDFFLINVNKFQYFKVYSEKVSTISAG